MNVVFYVPLLCALAVALAASRIARRASPRAGSTALVAAALASAAAADVALGALVGARLLDAEPLAALLRWRAERPHPIPVPVPISLLAAVALAALAAAAGVDWRRSRRAVRHLRSLHATAPPGELMIVRSPAALAHALPGIGKSPGRILVSDGMLRTLDSGERRVLLAHERSHLRHRHDCYRRLVRIAARINPLVRPVVAATDFLLERWADEDAAGAVGSRRLTARAVARAALTAPSYAHFGEPSFAAQHVAARVDALLATTPSARSRLALVLPLVLATIAILGAVAAGHEVAHLFDLLRGDG
jgi:Peptidase family M48